MTVGLKGHVMGVAFPEGYSNWQETDLHDLIDAELVPEPTDKNVVKAVRKLAKDADSIVIATDFDREGELIGLEALQQVLDANPDVAAGELESRPPVARARYSALTKDEIERAFSEPRRALLRPRLRRLGAPGHRPDLGRDPDPRGLARQPPLRLQLPLRRPGPEPDPGADRRARARAPRARAEALLGAVREVRPSGRHRSRPTTRPTSSGSKAEADAALAGTRSPGVVKEVSSRKNTRKPPTPLNTTAFTTDASSRLGITPAAAMRIAEDLYMDGFISYPRTDNTVYPPSLNTKELVSLAGPDPGVLGRQGPARRAAAGDPRQEGDHRPPADLPDPGGLPERARGPEAPRLRARRPPLPRHLLAADDHRVDPGRHRGRLGDLLRPRLGRRRPRLRRASTPTPAPPTRRSRSSRRARASTSTATRGSSTRRPSRRRGSARAS